LRFLKINATTNFNVVIKELAALITTDHKYHYSR